MKAKEAEKRRIAAGRIQEEIRNIGRMEEPVEVGIWVLLIHCNLINRYHKMKIIKLKNKAPLLTTLNSKQWSLHPKINNRNRRKDRPERWLKCKICSENPKRMLSTLINMTLTRCIICSLYRRRVRQWVRLLGIWMNRVRSILIELWNWGNSKRNCCLSSYRPKES